MRHKRENLHYGMEQRGRDDLRNLTASLFLYEKVVTTPRRAKRVKAVVDKMITLGKKGTTASIRRLNAYFWDKNVSRKIIEDLVPQLKSRNSGYTRLLKLGNRAGDGSQKVMVELLVPHKEKTEKEEKKSKVTTKVRKSEEQPQGWLGKARQFTKQMNQKQPKTTTRTTSK